LQYYAERSTARANNAASAGVASADAGELLAAEHLDEAVCAEGSLACHLPRIQMRQLDCAPAA
jgi:hypothetical protein